MQPPTHSPKIPLHQHLSAFLGSVLLKLLACTLRVRCHDAAHFYNPARKLPVILCIWHNRLLGALLGSYRVAKRAKPLSVLTSASKDGSWLATIARHFRLGAVRGSSSRRGAAALLGMMRQIGAGGDMAITPDGPRGPNYSIAPGLIHLSQSTGAPIVPVEVQIARKWHLGKKWDALWIPKPFSTITITFHPPLHFPMETPLATASTELTAAMGAK